MGFFGWLFGRNRRSPTAAAESVVAVGTPAAREPVAGTQATVNTGASSLLPDQRVIRVEHVEDVAVVAFVSSDAFYGSDFPARNEVAALVEVFGCRKLLLDFSEVEYLPSYALGWMITLYRILRNREGRLVLWKLNSSILELIRICRIDRLFTIFSEQDHSTICAVIRAGFGNVSRPADFSPQWRTATAIAIACQMSETRDFHAMPILADALQDAGCDSAQILDHCRGPGPHICGCWVVDLVLAQG
jgi:anti-anti-sigma factor